MSNSTRLRGSTVFSRWLLGLGLLIVGGLSLADLSALGQPPEGKPQKPRKDEVEEPTIPHRKPPKEDDGDSTLLTLDPREVAHPDVKELYRKLEVPHDEITYTQRNQTKTERVMLIPHYLGQGATFSGTLDLKLYDAHWKLRGEESVHSRNVQSVTPYEQIASAEVDKFLRSGHSPLGTGDSKPLSRHERLQAAERVLEAVLYASARRVRAKSRDWMFLEDRLKRKLEDIRTEHLGHLTAAGDWDRSYALADEMAKKYPT